MTREIPIRPPSHGRQVAIWLFLCAGLVFVMVLLGGTTRLSNAGLSIVEWKPLTGILPPLSEAEWQAVFAQYRAFPEYEMRHIGMTLAEFKSIFWLEYLHRLWGRFIGAVFFFPFLYFWLRGALDRKLAARLLGVFLLGAFQGWLGWYMVQSGLVERPDVSPYRLAAHLGLASIVFALLFRLGLSCRPTAAGKRPPSLFGAATNGTVALVFLTILAGAFVAGIDAGLTYNTFPRMGEGFAPDGYWALEPAWRNFFENIPSVQFNHRLLGGFTFLWVVALWLASWRATVSKRARLALGLLLAMAALQAGLGIATLLHAVPLPLGVAHQAGALLLFTLALWAGDETRREGN